MPAMEESGMYGEVDDVNMVDDDATLIPGAAAGAAVAAAVQPASADAIKKFLQRYVFRFIVLGKQEIYWLALMLGKKCWKRAQPVYNHTCIERSLKE